MQDAPVRRAPFLVFGFLILWLAGTLIASRSGWLGSLSPLAPPPLAALSMLIPSLAYFLLPPVRSYFAGIGLRGLTAVHILRIAAVPLFFWYGSRGLLPIAFVNKAGYGDLAAGLLALAVVLVWRSGSGYWTMHLFGVLDFLTAFATAIRLTTANPGAMHAITGLPMALIPFYGVGVFATIHVIAFDLLLRAHPATPNSQSHLRSLEAK